VERPVAVDAGEGARRRPLDEGLGDTPRGGGRSRWAVAD
jgi:hypothetical protein